MNFTRIGDKVLNREKMWVQIEKILDLRVQGFSQQEVARQMSLDRGFISRLESLGEIRKGNRIALVAFPIKNKEALLEIAENEGVEFSLVFTEKERWAFVKENSGLDLFNKVMGLVTELKGYDCLVVLASNHRIKLFQSIFDNEVLGMEIGQSPIEEDRVVDLKQVRELIRTLKADSNREAKR